MDKEQHTPDTSCENMTESFTQEPLENDFEKAEAAPAPEEECDASYTAVIDGQQDNAPLSEKQAAPSQTPALSSASLRAPNAGKGNKTKTSTGTKLLIAFVSVILGLIVLMIGASFALMLLLVTGAPKAPAVIPPLTHESVSVIYSSTEPSEDVLPPESDQGYQTETPPSNYSTDSWYNPDDLSNDALSAYEKVCALCNPSVVAISTDAGSGSGVIWTSDGYIVTNNHVVEGASSLSVMLSNGKKYPASLIDTSPENDLALIRINVSGLLPAQQGDSEKLRMGQPVVAIGNALGILSNTATEGILSSITREINVEGQTMNLMQISAPVNPGNSGGGCFDITGKLIGIVNAKTSAAGIEGLGYAIPVNTAKTVIGQMIANDNTSLQKGLGISGCYEITESNYADFSSVKLIQQIEILNGAPLYGIYIISDGMVDYVDRSETFENGDVLTSVNGIEVKTLEEVAAIVEQHEVGDELTMTVLRLTQSGGVMRPTYALETHTFKIRVVEMYK